MDSHQFVSFGEALTDMLRIGFGNAMEERSRRCAVERRAGDGVFRRSQRVWRRHQPRIVSETTSGRRASRPGSTCASRSATTKSPLLAMVHETQAPSLSSSATIPPTCVLTPRHCPGLPGLQGIGRTSAVSACSALQPLRRALGLACRAAQDLGRQDQLRPNFRVAMDSRYDPDRPRAHGGDRRSHQGFRGRPARPVPYRR